jgi:hypothetical protein
VRRLELSIATLGTNITDAIAIAPNCLPKTVTAQFGENGVAYSLDLTIAPL